jgi:hypothetical protein
MALLKYFAKVVTNTVSVQKMQEEDQREAEAFERLQHIRRLLGQDDKASSSFSSLPTTLTSLRKSQPSSQIMKWMKECEIKMHCKDVLANIIQTLEANDPMTVSKQVLGDVVRAVEQRNFAILSTQHNKRKRTFKKSNKTWKERATILYFFLHEYLGRRWVEMAIDNVDKKQRSKMEIRRTFQKCGLDPSDPQQELFAGHLQSLSNEVLYNALIQGNTALKF